MAEETTSVANINLDMLDRAATSEGRTPSVMDNIHTFKIYNPAPNTKAEAEKAGKFSLKAANTGTETFVEGVFKFNILDVSYFYSGSIYPLLDNGAYGEDKIFFFTNEFGKFAKKVDTIGLAAKNKPIGFFQKGEFEEMIRSPQMNGRTNQFFEMKKDNTGKPYNSSQLVKRAMIYGQFIGGEHHQEFFRMVTSTNNIGVTFKDGEACDALPGTLEYAVSQGLTALNDLLVANGRKALKSINPDQCDITVSIRENDKGNFLPVFEFAGLVAARGEDNVEYVKYIHDLKADHFQSIFGTMIAPTPILISAGNASVTMSPIALSAPKAQQEIPAEFVENDAEFASGDAFGTPPGASAVQNASSAHTEAGVAAGLTF